MVLRFYKMSGLSNSLQFFGGFNVNPSNTVKSLIIGNKEQQYQLWHLKMTWWLLVETSINNTTNIAVLYFQSYNGYYIYENLILIKLLFNQDMGVDSG